jgi:nitrogenase-stabilizing/protective protein
MQDLITQLQALSSAEDFFRYFGVPYEERVLHVHRLHILKRFYQYLHQAGDLPTGAGERAAQDPIELFRRYRELLRRAYDDFVVSTAQREKVFKVFQDADGRQAVPLAALRESLADRRRAA